MLEWVDKLVSKTNSVWSEGSSPSLGTSLIRMVCSNELLNDHLDKIAINLHGHLSCLWKPRWIFEFMNRIS